MNIIACSSRTPQTRGMRAVEAFINTPLPRPVRAMTGVGSRTGLIVGLTVCAWTLGSAGSEPSLKSAPPVVVKTVPVSGATDVDPGLKELQVTFSKPMQDGSWSWTTWGEENFPETTGAAHYLADGRTCVLPVSLKPGKFYATWLNSEKFHNFQDQDDRPAVPYLLTFRTAETEKLGASKVADPEPAAGLANAVVLRRDSGIQAGFESLSASGHAVQFDRPANARFVEAVQIFGSRYGTPEPPKEDFHLYLLNEQLQVLADVPFPYSLVERADMKWYTLRTPSIEVPDKFTVALAFNPHRTKGIYLAYAETAPDDCHSQIGLPGEGFEKFRQPIEWMVRVCLTAEPTRAKGFQSLADWQPPVAQDPFAGCLVVPFGGDKSEGMQSYSGAGPAVRFKPAESVPGGASGAPLALRGLRLFAGRYGSGYSPDQTKVRVQILDEQGTKLADTEFPYAKFNYRAAWVDLVFAQPVLLKDPAQPVTIALNPEATQFKGIYFHYQKNPAVSHSLAGTASDGFKPLTDREWMIRACFENPAKTGK